MGGDSGIPSWDGDTDGNRGGDRGIPSQDGDRDRDRGILSWDGDRDGDRDRDSGILSQDGDRDGDSDVPSPGGWGSRGRVGTGCPLGCSAHLCPQDEADFKDKLSPIALSLSLALPGGTRGLVLYGDTLVQEQVGRGTAELGTSLR